MCVCVGGGGGGGEREGKKVREKGGVFGVGNHKSSIVYDIFTKLKGNLNLGSLLHHSNC